MAKFNNAPQTGSDPNYMGFSREIDKPQNYKTPNRGLASLFEGIGDVIDLGTKAADTSIKNDIQNQLYSGVDKVRKDMGVDTATDLAEKGKSLFDGEGKPLPPGASNAKEEVERLTAAHQNGQLNDSYYWGRINALTKQVRTQYPGYREEIDKTISGIVGTNPANALRNSIQNEYEASTREATAKANRFETFVEQNQKYLPSDYYERQSKGNPYGETELKSIVAQKKSNDYDVDRKKADLELRASTNKLSADDAEGEAIFMVQSKMNEILGETARGLGNDIYEKIKSGKPLSDEETKQFNALSAKLMYQAETLSNHIINQPFANDSKNSFASVIKDPARLKNIKDNGMSFIKSTLELMTNGQYGLANQNANLAKSMQDRDVAMVMQKSEATRKIMAAQKVFGPAFNAYFSTDEGRGQLSDAQQALRTLNMSENLTGESEGLKAQLDRLRDPKTQKVDPVNANTIIRDVTGVLTSKEFDVNAKRNYAISAFGEKSLDFINQFQDKKTVYLKMLNPEVTKSMIELKGQAPEAFEAYSKWAATHFQTVFKSEANTVQNFITSGEGAQIKFDPATNQFGVFVDPKYKMQDNAVGGPGMMVGPGIRVQGMTPEKAFDLDHPGLRASITSVNQMLKTLEPIVQAQTDGNPTEALIGVITGIDPKAPKEQGMLQMLWQGIKNAIVPGAKAEEGKPGKQSSNEGGDEMVQLAALTGEVDDTANPLDEEAGAGLGSGKNGDRKLPSFASSAEFSPLLNVILGAEAKGGFNTIYGGQQAPLDQMTVSEVLKLQDDMKRRGSDSTAVGGGQFIQKTLKSLVAEGVVKPDELFTQATQEKLISALLHRRGYAEWKAGKLSDGVFMDNLAQEWAGLPTFTTGRSHYDGDGLNKANVSKKDVWQALQQMKGNRTA